jgi:hypothetical protein
MATVACAVLLGGCAGHKERLAKCSADENPVGALAFAEEKRLTNGGVITVQQMTDDCGPMRPVNQF